MSIKTCGRGIWLGNSCSVRRIPALALAATFGFAPAPIDLSRVFVNGEHDAYLVHADLHVETWTPASPLWLPDELEFRYRFGSVVSSVSAAGIASIRYTRPEMQELFGERFDAPPRTEDIQQGLDFDLQISPANEMIDAKPHGAAGQTSDEDDWHGPPSVATRQASAEDYRAEFIRLAMFVGDVQSSLDFAPRLPFDPVNPGDTWKRTVSYVPGASPSISNQQTHRVDYTYTFSGVVKTPHGLVDRVHAALHLSEDLAGAREGRTAMTLDTQIDFDLDPKTRKTLYADAKSTGEIKSFSDTDEQNLGQIDKIKAETTLSVAK